jgi:hypothetical protein
MSFIIPTQSLPAFSFEIALEGSTYRLAFIWNTRHEYWTMDLKDRQGNILIGGIKLVINYEILFRYRRGDVPPGAIVPLDITGRLERIGRNDLGTNVKLIYLTADEVDGIIS